MSTSYFEMSWWGSLEVKYFFGIFLWAHLHLLNKRYITRLIALFVRCWFYSNDMRIYNLHVFPNRFKLTKRGFTNKDSGEGACNSLGTAPFVPMCCIVARAGAAEFASPLWQVKTVAQTVPWASLGDVTRVWPRRGQNNNYTTPHKLHLQLQLQLQLD